MQYCKIDTLYASIKSHVMEYYKERMLKRKNMMYFMLNKIVLKCMFYLLYKKCAVKWF